MPGIRKTVCALTREQFRLQAVDLPVQIDGISLDAAAKEFSTGSLGWNLSEKRDLKVGDTTVRVQIGLNVTIIGSKEAA